MGKKGTQKMWNYRIVKEGNELSIKEVFYDVDKKPIMYGSANLSVDLEMQDPIKNEALHIANVLTCMADSILNADDFKGRNEVTDIVDEVLKQSYNPTETMH